MARAEPELRVAFLTEEDLAGYVTDDVLAADHLMSLGVLVEFVAWQKKANWQHFDAAIIRSTWHYQKQPEQFLRTIEEIATRTTLWNPAGVVRWNLDKRYLTDRLADLIVPSVLCERLDADLLEQHLSLWGCAEVLIKPTVGAGAYGIFRFGQNRSAWPSEAFGFYKERPCLLQPFLPSIKSEGERSLVYFAGKFSHAVCKTPARADFRVQEEFGAHVEAVKATGAEQAIAEMVLARVAQQTLYARVDLVGERDQPRLMELELIEPALYFRTDPLAAERFARAVLSLLAREG